MKIRKGNELTEEITAPNAVLAALSTGRPQILRMAMGNIGPLSAEESTQLCHVICVLMETNQELQKHSEQLAQQAEQIIANFKGVTRKLHELHSTALFTELYDSEAEG